MKPRRPRDAPQAFRTQERVVTAADHAAASAERMRPAPQQRASWAVWANFEWVIHCVCVPPTLGARAVDAPCWPTAPFMSGPGDGRLRIFDA